jgi:hypothetical protein
VGLSLVYDKGIWILRRWEREGCFPSVTIRNRGDGFCWQVIDVYGPVMYELKTQIL